jgi:hypothetical protein
MVGGVAFEPAVTDAAFPIGDLALGFVAQDAVALLDLAGQLFPSTIDDVDIVGAVYI